MNEQMLKLADQAPWFFMCVVLLSILWKAGKWAGHRLLNEETGILPRFARDSREDTKQMKESIAESREHAAGLFTNSMQNTRETGDKIIKAVHDSGNEVKILLGKVIKNQENK